MTIRDVREFDKLLSDNELLNFLKGNKDCSEGNPCYYVGCVACFVRGSIAVLPGRERIAISCHDHPHHDRIGRNRG